MTCQSLSMRNDVWGGGGRGSLEIVENSDLSKLQGVEWTCGCMCVLGGGG